MKNFVYLLPFFVLLMACSEDEKDENVSERDKVVNQITESTWVAEDVDHGTDGNLTDQYADFTIAFTKTKSTNFIGEYFVANGSYAFPDTFGKWSLSDDLKTVLFDNGQELAVEFENERMILDFTVSPPGDGRTTGLSGHFTFTLKHIP